MAFRRSIRLLNILKTTRNYSQSQNIKPFLHPITVKKYQVKQSTQIHDENLVDIDDPDTFGNLSKKIIQSTIPEDEGDIKEEQYSQYTPFQSQKLTTRQYADLIKQYLKHKRINEAIDVLETRMLKEDRVQPENYIYNILIGACADVGYTKKAFKLYNDMKKRGLKPTGDTYTCLFTACANSPFKSNALKLALHLRDLMIEKGVEPNLTNYHSMIKAFAWCGDVSTAFKIADEMKENKIKLRVHTFNHLLHACISDKEKGLKHALVVWRKMIQKEKPNIYSFNLMLRCVKECQLGTNDDLVQVLETMKENPRLESNKNVQIENKKVKSETSLPLNASTVKEQNHLTQNIQTKITDNNLGNYTDLQPSDNTRSKNEIQILDYNCSQLAQIKTEKRLPNLLSKVPDLTEVLSFKSIQTPQEKFALIGGQEDFLQEMEVYSVKPDIKVFTQMLMVIDDNVDAETRLIETMKQQDVKTDIDFYNVLMKKRCLRLDDDAAREVMEIIERENQIRKRKHRGRKNRQLRPNAMTYGILAMSCRTKEDCVKFVDDMKAKNLRINIETLGTLLKHGTTRFNFDYVKHVMKIVHKDHIKVNDVFLRHLEEFNDRCDSTLKESSSIKLRYGYKSYITYYNDWLKIVKADEALKPTGPWEQFKQPHPQTVQRDGVEIVQPKKYYKKRRFVKPYTPPKM